MTTETTTIYPYTKRYATVRGKGWGASLGDAVAAYLPENYTVYDSGEDDDGSYVRIQGSDVAGWTMGEYVIPRLASGMYWAVETCSVGICRERAVARLQNDDTRSVFSMCKSHRHGFRHAFTLNQELPS